MSAPLPQHRNAQPQKDASQPIAPPQQPPSAASAVTKEWAEDDYVLALAHLERLQDTVSSLRTTIPQLVRSLTRKQETPHALFKGFSREAINGNRKLAELKKAWEGGDMRDIRVKMDSSMKQHGKSIDGLPKECVEGVKEELVEMPKYGWIEEGDEIRSRKRKREQDDGGDGATADAQAEETIVEEFGKRHEHVTVQFDKETRRVAFDLKTCHKQDLHFDISPNTKDGKVTYDATGPRIPDPAGKGKRKLYQAIQRCVSSRPKAGNLDHTLETLAAYRDLGQARCVVCASIVDGEVLLAAARRSKRVKTDAGEEVKWIATHESCMKEGT